MNEDETTSQTVDRVAAGLAVSTEATAVEEFEALRPADQADVLVDLPEERLGPVIDEVSDEDLAGLLPELEDDEFEKVLAQFDAPRLARVLDLAPADTAADAIQALEEADREEVLRLMTTAEAVRTLLGYDEDDAGGLMLPNVVALRETMTVESALGFLRRTRPSAESIYYLYVVDDHERLLGVVGLRDLVTNPPRTTLRDVMDSRVVSVRVGTDQELVARTLQRYNLLAIPVVDTFDRLIGSITVDDVMDVVEEETTEDMFRMVGVAADERAVGPLLPSLRRRTPWLLINLAAAFVAALVVGSFEATIAAFAILAAFLPVVAGEGGLATSQTVTIAVRSLVLGEIGRGEGWRLLGRETLLGLLNGVIVGVLAGTVAWLWQGNPVLGGVVAAAVVGNLVVAGAIGAALPLGLRAAGRDPAGASTGIVTSLTDIAGLLLFLGLATLVLPALLAAAPGGAPG